MPNAERSEPDRTEDSTIEYRPRRLSVSVSAALMWGFGVLVFVMRRHALTPALKANWKTGTLSGVLSFPAYALVIWAMTLSPLTYVSALRETSVILAVLIGTRLMGEPFGARRMGAAATVALGVVLLQVSQ